MSTFRKLAVDDN